MKIKLLKIYKVQRQEHSLYGYCIDIDKDVITLYNKTLNKFYEVLKDEILHEAEFLEYLEMSEMILVKKQMKLRTIRKEIKEHLNSRG